MVLRGPSSRDESCNLTVARTTAGAIAWLKNERQKRPRQKRTRWKRPRQKRTSWNAGERRRRTNL